MQIIDFKRRLKHLYDPPTAEIVIIEVPPMNFLMVDGTGDPNKVREFQDAIEALFGVSYILKHAVRQSELKIDYNVMPLEGLWSSNGDNSFNREDKDAWRWTLMIMQPEYVNRRMFEMACEQLVKKKELPAIAKMRFDSYFEGASAQVMHVGLFSEEGPTIDRLHRHIRQQEYLFNGRHHEIYLSDINSSNPDKWRTVVRQPVKKEK